MFVEIRNQRGWLLFSFLPTSRVCGKELLSKTIFILCITLDWRLQASVYCHWISDVVCFATCNLNVSSHTRKGPRLGKCSCIFCFASLQNRVLINGCLRSWFFITRIFNMSLFCPHSSILLQFNMSCLQGRLSFYFRFLSFFFFHLLLILFLTFVLCFFWRKLDVFISNKTNWKQRHIHQPTALPRWAQSIPLSTSSTQHIDRFFDIKARFLFLSFFFGGGGGGGKVQLCDQNQPVIKVEYENFGFLQNDFKIL